MEVICSSETSVDNQRTTRRYVPEDGTIHNHRCDNLILLCYSYLNSWHGIPLINDGLNFIAEKFIRIIKFLDFVHRPVF
jgi:hypothetical protein